MASQDVSEVGKIIDLLNPDKFVKFSFEKKLLLRQPKRVCSVVQSDTVKMAGNGNTLFTFDILKDVLSLADSFQYVSFLGLVISGEWLVPKNTPGSAEVLIVDNRLKGKFSVLSRFECNASVQSFQFKTAPNYSLTVEDAKKSPFELFATVKDLPFKDGFNPLSVEVACLVQFSNCVIDRSLTVKLNMEFKTNEITVEQTDELLGELPVLKTIDNLRRTKSRNPSVSGRLIATSNQKSVNLKKPKTIGMKKTHKVNLSDNTSTFGDAESVKSERSFTENSENDGLYSD